MRLYNSLGWALIELTTQLTQNPISLLLFRRDCSEINSVVPLVLIHLLKAEPHVIFIMCVTHPAQLTDESMTGAIPPPQRNLMMCSQSLYNQLFRTNRWWRNQGHSYSGWSIKYVKTSRSVRHWFVTHALSLHSLYTNKITWDLKGPDPPPPPQAGPVQMTQLSSYSTSKNWPTSHLTLMSSRSTPHDLLFSHQLTHSFIVIKHNNSTPTSPWVDLRRVPPGGGGQWDKLSVV